MTAGGKVSKEAIIAAAVEPLREGTAALNARSAARKLGTQPIDLSFRSVDGLKAAVTRRAMALCPARPGMAPLPGRGGPLPPVQPPQRLRLRLCEVRGAGKVPFPLALPGRGAAWPRQDDVLLLEILGVITDESGCPPAPAEKPRRGMTCCFRGQAILAGAGHLGLTDEGRLGRLPWGAHRPGCPPRRLAHPAASGSGRRFSWAI